MVMVRYSKQYFQMLVLLLFWSIDGMMPLSVLLGNLQIWSLWLVDFFCLGPKKGNLFLFGTYFIQLKWQKACGERRWNYCDGSARLSDVGLCRENSIRFIRWSGNFSFSFSIKIEKQNVVYLYVNCKVREQMDMNQQKRDKNALFLFLMLW